MLAHLHQDLLDWSDAYVRMTEGSCLSYPHSSPICAMIDGVSRSARGFTCKVPRLDAGHYFKTMSRAIARLPEDQRTFLGKVYVTRELNGGKYHLCRRSYNRHLHRLHLALADLLREA